MGRKPLNGVGRMTSEEKNARRRELDRDPFHHALSLRTAKAWRDRNPDKIAELNARRRAKYAANRERERARAKAWREANPDKVREAWKHYASKPGNRAKLRERDRKRYATPEARERLRELRRKRIAENPRCAARVRFQKRLAYHTHKHDGIGLRWMFLQSWSKLWPRVVAGGDAAIEKYHRRTKPRIWSYFLHWRRGGVEALENLWGVKI